MKKIMNKKKEVKIENNNLEGLFPFLLLLLIGLFHFIISKKKKDQSNKRSESVVIKSFHKRKLTPPKPIISPPTEKQIEKECIRLETEKNQYYEKNKKQTRIQNLVASVGNKRKMIILSEILKDYDFLKF